MCWGTTQTNMKHRLFTILSILSLLLCAAMLTSWVRSYWVGDQWIWSDGADRPPHVYRMGHRYVVTLVRGHLYVMHDTSWWFPPQFRYIQVDNLAAALPPSVARRSVLGFEWAEYTGTPGPSSVFMPPFLLYRIIGVPHWFLAVCAVLLPCPFLIGRWRLHCRLRQGLCPICGYDLRASKNRCPECGTLIPAQPAS